jgi:hypothetical protein
LTSHETKRVLGTASLLFIVALFAVGALPFPGPRIEAVTRTPPTGARLPPALIFHDNLSLAFENRSFNLSLTRGHHYMWRFNVTYGSMMINLTDPVSHAVVWSVGPRSSGSMYLNGTGVASFNWTAPSSGYYLLSFQRLSPSQWVGFFGPFVCDVQIWDPDSHLLSVYFSSSLS